MKFLHSFRGFRSFNAKNLSYAGQRAAKLPAIKLWEWFEVAGERTRADWFERGRGWLAVFFLRPPTLTAGNFEALWPKDLKFLSLKDLNLFNKYTKYQKTSYNFRLDFALSNRPHFHRADLVTVCSVLSTFVNNYHTFERKHLYKLTFSFILWNLFCFCWLDLRSTRFN